ncbi:unnamed protein product [Mytilus edulis]|uniref:Uncharacterized protein n=1 Tax=Mytilus edulis TaxID=6550 RepID=A0A8S3SB98_MYTED|nr:unnamed protein product [Mytilus edulis]
MSKIPIICILLVIIVISVDVEGHKRGGRKNGKDKPTGGRKGKRNKKRRCQCKVASVKTLSKCRKNGRRRTCSKVKQYFFTKKQCNYPFDDLNAGETDDSGSNDGSDDGTDPNDGTGSDDGTDTDDGTGSDDGNDDGAGTGGGLDADPGETLPGDGVDDDQVDIILIGDCTDTENPEDALQKCAASIKQDPPLYYLETSCSTHFIQCDEHGGADIKPFVILNYILLERRELHRYNQIPCNFIKC